MRAFLRIFRRKSSSVDVKRESSPTAETTARKHLDPRSQAQGLVYVWRKRDAFSHALSIPEMQTTEWKAPSFQSDSSTVFLCRSIICDAESLQRRRH